MKNIIQEIKDCSSVRINCFLCGAGERVYFIPESIISKLEVVVAKMETTTPTATCKDSLQVGNAAKMRKALERLREWVLMDLNENAFIADSSGNYMKLIEGTIEIANAALSAPPRNCDLFGGDPKKLHKLWWEWSGDLKNCNADGTVKFTFGEWLLERAKGGAHADR